MTHSESQPGAVVPAQVEPCGALRVLELDHGDEALVRWCSRVDGPCLFPGAPEAKGSERLCGAGPTKRLRVSWSEQATDDALRHLLALRDVPESVAAVISPSQTVAVAIDALRTCGADETRFEEPF